jgi:hypothetical protein
MSNLGKTLLRGHALQYEGRPRFESSGVFSFRGEHAMCECGQLAPGGISQKAAQRWHREHKDSLR